MRIDPQNGLDHIFNCRGVEKILLRVIICRSSDNHHVGPTVSLIRIKSRLQVKILPGQITLDILVLYRRLTTVDHLHPLRHDVHRHYAMFNGDKRGYRHSHIPCTCYCNFHVRSFK